MSLSDLVTIGIPTHNAESTIRRTLEAVLAQEYEPVEIIVADNASSDATVEICRQVAAGDPRVRIVAHDVNGGWQFNFRFLLAQASGEYFMWVGADDRPSPRFVTENVGLLRRHPELVTSVSRVRWLYRGEAGGPAAGTAPLTGSPRANIAAYLRHARDNSRFYGLHRTDVLRDSFPAADFYGLDLAVMVGTLRHGGHGEVPEVLLERERSDPAAYVRHIERDASGFADRLLPLLGFTRAITRELRAPMSPSAIWWLAMRNGFEHLRYWSTTDGLYGRLVGFVFKALDRRRAQITRRDDADSHRGPR